MTPMRGKALIRIAEIPTEIKFKSGSLILAGDPREEYDRKSLVAEVLEVGRGVTSFVKGDQIIIGGSAGRWIGKDVIDDALTLRVIDEDEAIAVIHSKVASTVNGKTKHLQAA